MSDAPFLYEELASFISRLVDRGTLAPGTRVPSLRDISQDRGVAISTALQAYRLLEDRGIIEARPKSGYYVVGRRTATFAKPSASTPPENAAEVAISSVALKLLEYASDPRLIPLGCAIPSSELLAAERLDRLLARKARAKGREFNIYTAPKGDLQLRVEIARRAMHWQRPLSPEDIIVTNGCTEALSLALRSVTKAGDTVAIESPTYFGLLQALEALDLKALELPTDPTTGADLLALERALASREIAACLFASSFSNPLGCTMPDERKRATLDLITKYGVPLIEDDIYGDIYFGTERPRPFAAFDSCANIIYCSSFSKTLAPGYRIGWVTATRNTEAILGRKFASTLCSPALLQSAVADFLGSGGYEHHLRRLRSVLKSNLDRMTLAVEKSFPTGTKVTQPAGGFVLWLELPRSVNTRALFDSALGEGICFAPGDVFSTSSRYNNCLRLGCTQPWDTQIERGVIRIGELASLAVPCR
ncbi:MAG: PLP-dependent aminotransferase family protein [Rhodanobacteraceae bacterium]